jgi:hypothetical protein
MILQLDPPRRMAQRIARKRDLRQPKHNIDKHHQVIELPTD